MIDSTAANRRGTAIVFALVAMLVASLMIAALVKTASVSHRQLKRDEFRIQAGLLADAGSSRAIYRLQSQPDFTGETWNVPSEQLAADRIAIIRIEIEASPAKSDQRIAQIVAEYPVGHPDIVRVSRRFVVP